MNVEATYLRELFQRHAGVSQAEFGRANGLGTASNVYQYLHARRPLNLRAAVRFAVGLGVSLQTLSPRLAAELKDALRVAPELTVPQPGGEEYARIRCVRLRLSFGVQGYGLEPLEGVGEYIAFRHDWLRDRGLESDALLAVQVNDDGMRPTLCTGDLVVVNTKDTVPQESVVYAVSYEGEFRVRRLIRDAGEWWLYSDNPETQRFPRKQFFEKRCFILGKIVHRQSEQL